MTPAEQVGQLLMIGIDVDTLAGGARVVGHQAVGSVFLAGRSSAAPARIRRGVERLQALARRTSDTGLLVGIDQEGGSVQTLTGPGVSDIPTARAQGRLRPAVLEQRATRWAQQLRRSGANLNLAPVADVVPVRLRDANAPIGRWERDFGASPRAVARSVAAFTTGMTRGRVAAVVKHFPGLGFVRANTDFSDSVVDRAVKPQSASLLPFRAGIRAGAPVVMVSSATYAGIDPRTPAVLSPVVIGDLLRGRLGFAGVVMSDDVGRAAALSGVPVGERAVRFVAAGGDLTLTVEPSHARVMARALLQRAQRDPAFRTRVQESALRVLLLKDELGLLPRG